MSLRGRDREVDALDSQLRRLAAGKGMACVVEGGAGTGKTSLVGHAVATAEALGIRVGIGPADPSSSGVECAALLSALSTGADPLLSAKELSGLQPRASQRFWLLRDLEAALEECALDGPVLLCIDDAHWTDAGTAQALMELPLRLRHHPVGWLIATRPAPAGSPIGRSLHQLARAGASSITLGPLKDVAVAEVAGDLLGQPPDRSVLTVLDGYAGNPFLIVEALLGLLEEQRVRFVDGYAHVEDGQLPARVQDRMDERLARLTEPARLVATTAASLGRRFAHADLARLLDTSPAALLGPVEELLAADLIAERGAGFEFWHDVTREAVRASTPVSARRALDRHAAEVLLRHGAMPVEVAAQLVASAEPGDDDAAVTLLEAAGTLSVTDPATAAVFARKALDICGRGHARRGEMVTTATIALHMSAGGREAMEFADAALREAFPFEQEAEVRLAIAGMFSVSPDVRIATGRTALALPGLSTSVRARHQACLFYNLLVSARRSEARAALRETARLVEQAGDPHAGMVFRVGEAGLAYTEHRFTEAFAQFRTIHRDSEAAGDDLRRRMVHQFAGEMLSALDDPEEAAEFAGSGMVEARRDRQGWAYQMFEAWQARLLLRSGQISAAAAILEGQFDVVDGSHGAAFDGASLVAFGRASLHAGETRQVARLAQLARRMHESTAPVLRQHAAWLLALISFSENDVEGACRWLHSVDGHGVLPRFPQDTTDEILLARMALAARDRELAALALDGAGARLAANPGIRSIAATEANVRGLVEGDLAAIATAVDLFEGIGRPLEHACALEDLGSREVAVDRDRGVDHLGQSLTVFTEIGAFADARRVRGLLRNLGVRRRIVTTEPARSGWEAMTAAERAVAELVAQGMTNREAAEQLYVSPHTVNSHLRHVFGKLGISSRVELARRWSDERPPTADPATAGTTPAPRRPPEPASA